MTAPKTRPEARVILVQDVAVQGGDVTPEVPVSLKEGDRLIGLATLVAGVCAITIAGIATTSNAFVARKTPGGTLGTGGYKAVCTANTLTITAIDTLGALSNADTSTVAYEIVI